MFIRGWNNGLYCELYTDNPAYLEELSRTLIDFEYGVESYEDI